MEPFFAPEDKKLFYKYLKNSTHYFEYGSGGSTYQVSSCPNLKKIYSVESDVNWQNKLKQEIPDSSKIHFIFSEMNTKPNTWGYPGTNATDKQKKNYSNQLNLLTEYEQKNIDFILIDGRFRVACCLKTFHLIQDNCFIAFDDFLNRPQYHIVMDFFDIIEYSIDKKMVILKKKKNISNIPQNLIDEYELEAN